MELRGARAKTFGRLRRLFERGLVTGGDADEAMRDMMHLFGAQSVVLVEGLSFARWNIAINVPVRWLQLHTKYSHQDPSVVALAAAPRGETFLVDRDSTFAQKQTDIYYHLHDQGFRDCMIGTLSNPFVSDLALVLYRENGARPFSSDDDELFRTIYPHLAGGLAARHALKALQAPRTETMRDVLCALDGHAYVSFPSGAITWSADARALWRDRLGITGEAGWLRAENTLRASALQFNGPLGGRSQRVLPGLRVEWASVPARSGERRRMLALMFTEASSSRQATAVNHLLTPQQRRIARLAADGHTAREIGDELGIGVETVRWTLREIYRRLGIHRRAELAALLD